MAELTTGTIISIIDDDKNVRTAIEGLIATLGFVARTFASAEQFLASADCDSTSCLITDVQMAGLNGLDLHARLMAQGKAIPVIFITAFPDDRIQRRAESLGAKGFLSKPFETQALVQCIHDALGDGSKRTG
jgi:FixJ family two-component response regulator